MEYVNRKVFYFPRSLMASQMQIKKLFREFIASFINKYRIELGAINGAIFAIGIIEFVSHSVVNSLLIFSIGLLLFIISWRSLVCKNPMDNVPTQNN